MINFHMKYISATASPGPSPNNNWCSGSGRSVTVSLAGAGAAAGSDGVHQFPAQHQDGDGGHGRVAGSGRHHPAPLRQEGDSESLYAMGGGH